MHFITVGERVVLGQVLQEREQLLVDSDSESLVVVAAGQVLYGHQAHHSLLLVGVTVRPHELVLEHLKGSFSQPGVGDGCLEVDQGHTFK